MATPLGWIVLAATATADANGTTEIVMRSGMVERFEECSIWALAERGEDRRRHADPLSHPRTTIGCVEALAHDHCPRWRIAVVKDHDGQMLVDVDHDAPAMDDAHQQALALQLPLSGEKLAVLARWPVGSWVQATACPGERRTMSVEAPHRCAVVEPDGKPTQFEFGRGDEVRCVVTRGADRSGTILAAHTLPAAGDAELLPLAGELPTWIPPNGVLRVSMALAERWRDLHHVPYSLVAVQAGSAAAEFIDGAEHLTQQ